MASVRGRSSARTCWSCPRGGCQSPSPAWRGAGSVCAARPDLGPGLCCDTTSGLTSGRAWSPGSSTTTLTRTAGSRSTVSSSRPAQLTSGHPGCYQVSLSPLTSHFSPLTPGAAEASVWLDQVWVRPYTSQSAARWGGRISPDCPDLRTEAWREGRNYHVFSSTRDCLLSHQLTVRDLEILNIERSPAGHRHLWLGDLHTTPSLYFTNIFPASCSLLTSPQVKARDTNPRPTRATTCSTIVLARLTIRPLGEFTMAVLPLRQHSDIGRDSQKTTVHFIYCYTLPKHIDKFGGCPGQSLTQSKCCHTRTPNLLITVCHLT